jgi:hypothetical protein
MTRITRITKSAATLAIAPAILALAAREARAQWTATPYVWAAGLDARVSLNGTQVINQHIAFTELVEDVDVAAMLRVEGRFGRFGAMLDLFYIGMSTANDAVRLPNGVAGTLASEIGMTVLDATASYALQRGASDLAVFAGTRVLVERTQLDLTVPTSPGTTLTHSASERDWQPNAIVGLQFRRRLTSKLSMDGRGDIGSGGTRLTWSAGSEMIYAFDAGERFALRAGYRRLVIDYEEQEPVQASLTLSGLVTGFRIAF